MNHLDQNTAIQNAAYEVRRSTSIEIPPLKYGRINLRPRHPTSLISSEASAEDKPLFMATRKHQRSLSPISNGAPQKIKRLCRSTCLGQADTSRENLAWDTINKEISEWQDVCQTGRASWRSPPPKLTQRGARSIWQEERRTDPRRQSIDHCRHPRERIEEQRRAVTDSYLIETSNAQDLAHLVAVQLLSACFTIPADQISYHKSSAYHCFGTLSADDLRDSRMISSLRMHTEARNSPSFGHQARNTSPVNQGTGAYDGPSPPAWWIQCLEPPPLDIKDPSAMTREQRIHRVLHATERSTAECSTESHVGRYDCVNPRPAAIAKTWHDRKRGTEYVTVPRAPTRSVRSCPPSPRATRFRTSPIPPLGSSPLLEPTLDSSDGERSEARPGRIRRLSLRTVIRSDSHHIYIQPVKEVVARWRTLRRRVGRSLGYSSPDPTSGGTQDPSSVLHSPLHSTPSETRPGSPIFSSDGKGRRRQARERGEIHSSVESDSRYTIPPFGLGTGGINAVASLHESSRAASPLGSSTAISCPTSPGLIPEISLGMMPCVPLDPETSPGTPCSSALSTVSIEFRSERVATSGPTNTTKQAPSTSFSARRHSQRRQRKSMLSEMYAPEDAEAGQITLSEMGSTLVSPREESGSETGEGMLSQSRNQRVNKATPTASESAPITEYIIGEGALSGESVDLELPRPNMVRTSTSGTQVFRPTEDGVEIDGLPVGPAAAHWDDKRRVQKGKERSYL